ncbi:hypothetical protein K2173_011894 [Erythroxylum novogranatense]|uniref:Dof zinc finger protein n=1 Tax=Erythroxylum novogranatense TaxID=1862640 RepID=A0AAV8T0Q2_9ROSI|nr:hypothetical protein K2173_011894 [Erythroxylum novogranatense]
MVFTSTPVYPNWQQDVNHVGAEKSHQLQTQPPPGDSSGSTGSIRSGSMSERARLAKIPQPEAALKCPRCESPNTKFCYFNNYSLTQPRHFCKTCRRYWTRGGALRNVPVGGGCRRNKRSKRSRGGRSKSPVKNGSSSSCGVPSDDCSTDVIGHLPPPPPHLPFLPPLHHLGEYNSGGIGLSFAGIHPPVAATTCGFPIGSTSSSGGVGLVDRWRLQEVDQFPFLEQPSGLYPYQSEEVEARNFFDQFRSKPLETLVSVPSSLKMEENGGLHLPRNFMVISGNDQDWSGNAWIDLPGFTSSSISHLL